MRWLSLGQATERLFEMMTVVNELIYEKVQAAGKVKAKEVFEKVKNKEFWTITAYLADIFATFNKGCKKMQGDNVNMLQTRDAINSIVNDITKMINDLSSSNSNENLTEFKHLKKRSFDNDLKKHLIAHLKEIQSRYV